MKTQTPDAFYNKPLPRQGRYYLLSCSPVTSSLHPIPPASKSFCVCYLPSTVPKYLLTLFCISFHVAPQRSFSGPTWLSSCIKAILFLQLPFSQDSFCSRPEEASPCPFLQPCPGIFIQPIREARFRTVTRSCKSAISITIHRPMS